VSVTQLSNRSGVHWNFNFSDGACANDGKKSVLIPVQINFQFLALFDTAKQSDYKVIASPQKCYSSIRTNKKISKINMGHSLICRKIDRGTGHTYASER
jgi:hypothetical protein